MSVDVVFSPIDRVELTRVLAGDHVRHVPAEESVTDHVRENLEHDDIDFVHGRNEHGGCLSFEATRAASTESPT